MSPNRSDEMSTNHPSSAEKPKPRDLTSRVQQGQELEIYQRSEFDGKSADFRNDGAPRIVLDQLKQLILNVNDDKNVRLILDIIAVWRIDVAAPMYRDGFSVFHLACYSKSAKLVQCLLSTNSRL